MGVFYDVKAYSLCEEHLVRKRREGLSCSSLSSMCERNVENVLIT